MKGQFDITLEKLMSMDIKEMREFLKSRIPQEVHHEELDNMTKEEITEWAGQCPHLFTQNL